MNIQKIARQLIKLELQKRELSYQDLENLLTEAGYPVKKTQIANRLSRGVYKIDFFIQTMKVLGIRQVTIEEICQD